MPGHFGSSKPSAPPGGGATSLGSGRDYSPPSQPSGNGGDRVTDPGFVVALAEQQARQQDPVFGDPDPQIDISPEDRDSITSFIDNYTANVKANPLMAGLTGALITLYQTGKAKDLLRGEPGYEFLDSFTISDGVPISEEGQRDFIQNAISQLPYTITGTTPQESMVNKYFANLGMSEESPLSSKLETDYNIAKDRVNSVLNFTPVSSQFGYSTDPYGGLLASNLQTNPFNIEYLQTRGLI